MTMISPTNKEAWQAERPAWAAPKTGHRILRSLHFVPAQVQIGQTLKDDEFIGMVRREVRHPTSGLQGHMDCRCAGA